MEKRVKHLPQIMLTTALIEAWHGVFNMHYQRLPSSHSTFNPGPSPKGLICTYDETVAPPANYCEP
jgi:hypothetical protein